MKGLVIKSTGSWYRILDSATKTVYDARIRGKFKQLKSRLTNPLAVGDLVEFQMEDAGTAWITKIELRKNYLIRKAVNLSKEAHIIASNIDRAFVLYTLNSPETSLGFLDRFLVCCQAYSIEATILFNKIDLVTEAERPKLEYVKNLYEKLGYVCLETSSVNKVNSDKLKEMLAGKVSLFFGHSGSGKSTLVNHFQPDLNLKTAEISQMHNKGKHTTTFAQMHFWDFGGAVIDTPGVREFAMLDMEKAEIQDYFPEIFKRAADCKFHNCMHFNEPQCAVLQSVENGTIAESRYNTYAKLVEETFEV